MLQGALSKGKQRDDGLAPGLHTRMNQLHRAKDNKWFMVSMTRWEQFDRFVNQVIRRPELLTDPRTNRTERSQEDREWLRKEIGKVIAMQPRQHWLDACDAAGRLPCAPCSTFAEVGDPDTSVGKHIRANGYVIEADHRDNGPTIVVAQPVRFEGTPNMPMEGSWHMPHLGEHTLEVLTEIGYSDREVAELTRPDGAVRPAEGPQAREQR